MTRIGIMSAMQEEMSALLHAMCVSDVFHHGMRHYHVGTLWGMECVLVFSRWGKVAASCTASELISRFGVGRILFTGVAGGAASGVNIGDIVIGTRLIQHDMDARPIFQQHEIPLLGKTEFLVEAADSAQLVDAATRFLQEELSFVVSAEARREFGLTNPKVIEGEIASGDKFFADSHALEQLRARLPQVLCVEMEGAAVAQICHEYGIPFSIIRTISDSANEHAPINFQKFIQEVASKYSHGVIRKMFEG